MPIQSLVGPPNPSRHDSSLVLTVCQFCWQAKANLPKPPSDLKNKIKSTPSATMGLSFELADLQGQNNQSENYPSPGKGYQAGKPSETIGAIPDKASPLLGICPFLFSGKDRTSIGLSRHNSNSYVARQASQLSCSWPDRLWAQARHILCTLESLHYCFSPVSLCVDLPQIQ